MSNQTEGRRGGFDRASETRGLGGLVAVGGMLFCFPFFTLFWISTSFFAHICHHLSLSSRNHRHHVLVATKILSYFSYFYKQKPICADEEKVAGRGPATTSSKKLI